MELVHDGLIYTRVGKGTFVAEPKIDQQLRSLTGFTQDVQARGGQPNSQVLEAGVIGATPELAAALRLNPGDEVIRLVRLRLADGDPLCIESSHLPFGLFQTLLLDHDFSRESLYQVLEADYGLELTYAEQTIESALASHRELEKLQLIPPAAVLKIQRTTYGADGAPIEYVLSTYRGDRFKFRSTLGAGTSNP